MSFLARLPNNRFVGHCSQVLKHPRFFSTAAQTAQAAQSTKAGSRTVPSTAVKPTYVPSPLAKAAAQYNADPQTALIQSVHLFNLDKLDFLSESILALEKYKQAATDSHVSIQNLDALTYAKWHMKKQSDFSKSINLGDKPLYGQEASIQYAQKKFSILKQVIPENYHDVFNGAEAKVLLDYANKKNKEFEFGIEVEPDVYEYAKQQLVPSLLDLGVTGQDYIDFYGGPQRVLNPFSLKIAPIYERILNSKTNEERLKYQDILMVELKNYDPGKVDEEDEEDVKAYGEYDHLNLVYRQGVAIEKVSMLLGRDARFTDFDLESRFRAGGVRQTHPWFAENPRRYIYSEVSDVSKFYDKNEVEVKCKEFFNPPGIFRPVSGETIRKIPKLFKECQKVGLNFPVWEEDSDKPSNSSEALTGYRLWKLYNVFYPELDSQEKQLLFSEMYDISPGEYTMEWVMSVPMNPHTFTPEAPLWVNSWEEDEVGNPVEWPAYNPYVLEGKARLDISEKGKVVIKFLKPNATEELRSSLKAYLLDRMNKTEYTNMSLRGSDLHKKLTPADVLLASENWKKLSEEEKREVLELYSNPSTFENPDGLQSPRVLDEVRHLDSEFNASEFSSSLTYLEEYPTVAPGLREATSIKEYYTSLLNFNHDYFSAGGVQDLFSKLRLAVEDRLNTLNEIYPVVKEANSDFDLNRLLLDKNSLIEASKKIKTFLASDRFQELSRLERKRGDDKFVQENITDVDPEGVILPDHIYYRTKPVSELTEEEKVFAVISEFDELVQPVSKIIPNSIVIDYASQVFKPLQKLQAKLKYANERRYISAINEQIRPSPKDSELPFTIESLTAQAKGAYEEVFPFMTRNLPEGTSKGGVKEGGVKEDGGK